MVMYHFSTLGLCRCFAHVQLKWYIIVVTCAQVFRLICAPLSLGTSPWDEGTRIRHNTCAHVTTITPQIKKKYSATNFMFPFGPEQHLMMLPSPPDVALEGGTLFL